MAVFLIFFGFPTLFAVLGWGKKRKNPYNETQQNKKTKPIRQTERKENMP